MHMPSKKVLIHPSNTVNDAFIFTLRHHFDYMIAWLPQARSAVTPEGVQHVRSAIRRLESALTFFQNAFPHELTESMRQEMEWTARQLRAAKQANVLIYDVLGFVEVAVPSVEGQLALLKAARHYQTDAYDTVQKTLDGARFHRLQAEFKYWGKGAWGGMHDVPALAQANVCEYGSKRLDELYGALGQYGGDVGTLPLKTLNTLRIQCRMMRHGVWFLVSVFGKGRMRPFVSALRDVRIGLRTIRNAEVMTSLMQELVAELDDPVLNAYKDQVVQWLAVKQDTARRDLPELWQTFMQQETNWQAPKPC
jgi:CHAD domain-containing protein